jgi:hypothetical protein
VCGPYRQTPPARELAPAGRARDPEATLIYGLLGAIGMVRTAVAWSAHEPVGAEATVALTFVIAGVAGLIGAWLRR